MNSFKSNRQLFFEHVAPTSKFPLAIEISNAQGVYMYGPDGKQYIDFISGIGVSNVGHCHPKVVAAIQQQAQTYMHLMVYGEYVQAPQVKLAEWFANHLPPSLNSVYFTNSGAEAIEGAMKLVKRVTGRTKILSFHHAYHGSTQGALSLIGDESFKQNFRPLLPGCEKLHFNHIDDLQKINHEVAAVFIETIQGEAGYIPPSNHYLQFLKQRCTEVGALLVCDEIQCGAGRTGSWWAFEHYGITPDVLCLAKGIGGGMPIGAFIASQELMNHFTENPILGHLTTFGGHPVSCAAALACMQAMEEEHLLDSIPEKERLIRELLQHPSIKSISGKGLMLAVEFDSFETNKAIIDRCIERGVITDWFLFNSHSMRIAPPLIITKEEIEKACSIILSCIEE
jgi:acetylornithine/succinyldiaminopimelate/putrescine aminotransferase